MTIFDSVRQLLSQGDTAQALRLLITHLETEKSSPEALRILRVVEANYNTARQKEIKGILDFSEAQQAYSQTNDALLSVTEDLASGRKPSLEIARDDSQQSRIYWFIGGGILLLLGLIAGILLRNTNQTGPTAKPLAECPTFDTSGISVMLIPFQALGETKSNPELALQTRIRDLTDRNQMKSNVQLFRGDRFEKSTPDINEASEIGRHCQAKMVIWGQYEKVNEGIALDVRYLFTDNPNLPAGAIAETFRNLSELKAGSERFSNDEDALFSLCTAIALHEGRMDLAKKWLGKVKELSSNWQKIKDMLDKQ